MLGVSAIDILAVVVLSLFIYSAYNLMMYIGGILLEYRRGNQAKKELKNGENKPFFSIILPVKDEEKVVKRIIEALLAQNYPTELFEILIVEDGSTDRTPSLCRDYSQRYPGKIKYLHRDTSNGKPSALNYGLTHSKGEIVGVFDADNVPEPTLLTLAARSFNDPGVEAVQGQLRTINPDETLLGKIVHYERIMQLHLYALTKNWLGLFVPFAGTNLFLRHQLLNQVGAWEDNALSEDLELAAKLVQARHRITYTPELITWQETPATYRQLMAQRVRWYRGCMEVGAQYGKLLREPCVLHFDTELYLIGPFIMMLAFLVSTLYSALLLFPISANIYAAYLTQYTYIAAMIIIALWGLILANISTPRTKPNLKLLPLVYLYCAFQCFIAMYAFILIVLRRPRKWVRTQKTGKITTKNFSL